MKKIATILFLLLITRYSYSQFTITSLQVPHSGDTIYQSNLDTNFTIPVDSGANAVWDFSTINVMSYNEFATIYEDPSLECSSTDSASLGGTNTRSFSISTTCYQLDSDEFSIAASSYYGLPGHTPYTSIHYADRKNLLQLPFNYHDSFYDNYEDNSIQNPGSVLGFSFGFTYKYYGSYGELRLPWGNYPNVAKLEVVMHDVDSFAYNNGQGPFYKYIRNTYGYEWYDLNTHDFILAFYEHSGSVANRSVIAQTVGLILGVANRSDNNLSLRVFPNPSSGKFDIELPDNLRNISNAEVKIFDGLGKCIYQKFISTNIENIKIELASMPSGIYNITLGDNNTLLHCRVIIE